MNEPRLRSADLLDVLRPVAKAARAWGVDTSMARLPDDGPICLPLTIGEARAVIKAFEAAGESLS